MKMVDLVNQAARLSMRGDEETAQFLLQEAESIAQALDDGTEFFYTNCARK